MNTSKAMIQREKKGNDSNQYAKYVEMIFACVKSLCTV